MERRSPPAAVCCASARWAMIFRRRASARTLRSSVFISMARSIGMTLDIARWAGTVDPEPFGKPVPAPLAFVLRDAGLIGLRRTRGAHEPVPPARPAALRAILRGAILGRVQRQCVPQCDDRAGRVPVGPDHQPDRVLFEPRTGVVHPAILPVLGERGPACREI